ncbi:MAG TPA: hypothetical protein VK886_11130 [Vicinamibacterales bacterium]|nr:hypothetical protein [Vicinamibacterales bacterium]
MSRQVQAAALLAAVVVLGAGTQAQNSRTSDRLERQFAPGGTFHMNLSAGGYRIEGSPDSQIRVRWRTQDPEDMDRVRSNLSVAKSDATLRLDGHGNNFRADISVPERTHLVVRLSAGEIDVRRVEGSKDIDLWAGEVRIETGDADRYRSVSASVRAGEIAADVFRVNKGGLFRSFKYSGKGPYELRVRLFAGEVKLVR